ncbi:DNA cytosine methyltransferase [Candidatus Palauibacter sp.]|uniref:DNA cytosine methyltransferase n=1 Tax=Candidatus Palauibacter sp. TaxID=3101350 RepID=UPI003B52921C
MTSAVPVIDLFSGPGGLAEGFAAYRGGGDAVRFRIALSVEMEKSAHRTLRLRAFLRKFHPLELPSEYHEFLNGGAKGKPDWDKLYPEEWREAGDETRRLKLGTPEATAFVNTRVRAIRKKYGGRTVLLGGPPCQSYSLVGRARNAGNDAYDPAKDERQSLYSDYVDVLRELQPAVAIMENVKGMLSARLLGEPIFYRVMSSLRSAGGQNRYRLFALAPGDVGGFWQEDRDPRGFLVRTEDYGIPQARHRVIVVCVRRDIADLLPVEALIRLEKGEAVVPLSDVIGNMPMLRSRLSRGDSDDAWRGTVRAAYALLQQIERPRMTSEEASLFDQALDLALATARKPGRPYRDAVGGMAMSCQSDLRDWILDANLNRLPNHETRGHMPEDLGRYLFAAAFALAKGRSPNARDFPTELAPNHASWGTGKFGDRFRVQLGGQPCRTVTSHIAKDGHYFIHPDPSQCRSLTVREAARLQTFPDNYFFCGGRTQQYVQVGNAVPPFLALQIAERVCAVLDRCVEPPKRPAPSIPSPASRASLESESAVLHRVADTP